MFQKKEVELSFDIIIGPNSLIKGDLESEGSVRIDGKIRGNITALGNVIISENASVIGDIKSLGADIYGSCEGNINVRTKINLHQNAKLTGDIIAKSFNTKEGSTFNGNCFVDPTEELVITLDPMLQTPAEINLIEFTKPGDKNKPIEHDQKSNKKGASL